MTDSLNADGGSPTEVTEAEATRLAWQASCIYEEKTPTGHLCNQRNTVAYLETVLVRQSPGLRRRRRLGKSRHFCTKMVRCLHRPPAP